MKKIVFLFICAFSWSSLLSAPPDKIKYLDTVARVDEMKIKVLDGISTEEIVKAKVQFENKNEYFVLLDPGRSFFYINGNKVFLKEREIVIPPSGKRSKVLDTKVLNSQAQAISLVLDGFSKTGNEKTISFPNLMMQRGTKSVLGNVELIVDDVDYDKANKVNVRIKVKNLGNDILILNSSVIEAKEQDNALNNIRKRSSKILLRKGDADVIVVTFQTTGKGTEKWLVSNDAFVTAALFPMSPLEIVMCSNVQALVGYRYFSPAPVIADDKTKKAEQPLASNNTTKEKTPAKKTTPTKKTDVTAKAPAAKKAEPVAQEKPKRSIENEERELHASDIDFGNSGGKFYALLIGCSDYTDPGIDDLDGLPVKDALALENVLVSNYTFNQEDVNVLKSPTRREIVIALDNLSKKVTELDNVLIFYAGHGHYEDDNDIGYWLPKDAELSNSANWLYNDQLVAGLRKIKSLHTLLISDACFSGSIFKSRSISFVGATDVIKKKYQLPSRKAMTSGTLKTVPNKSVFIKYLVDRLEKNKSKYYSSSTLYQEIEVPVGNNSTSLPQFGVIQNVGDEGVILFL